MSVTPRDISGLSDQKKADVLRARAHAEAIKKNRWDRKSEVLRKIVVGECLLAVIAEGKPEAAILVKLINENLPSGRGRFLVRQHIAIEEFMPDRQTKEDRQD